ncbi:MULTISPECIES: tautomerase family protein [unclassified Pantoea]|jgi:phenylpyruvate tautomerase PptA (4-oxalocrotonate tautomerase family)|uniref:tautomerase family protein n=1 Tax=unclassified Pantoea TaxID=2630326 RepID=UPI0023DB9C2D|nr:MULTISPECIES: tautomerase family protein [unclassified Pantoea]MDF2043820.1 tautomerase family protein [Pantoea sp. Cr_R14]MDF2069819.1 tautomerase family protein [Pantoea sp. Cr_R13]MDF2081422.1 tautomerase family protein [Pantoea sp. Cr_R21]
MPTFHAHIAAQTFSSEEKRGLADALNLALHEAMDTPMEDRFIIITEHKEDEFFIHPTFPEMKRSEKRMLVTVTTGISRTVEQKRKLAELVTRYAVEKAGVSQDDISLLIYAIPLENMSFGAGKLVSDAELSMPWVNK